MKRIILPLMLALFILSGISAQETEVLSPGLYVKMDLEGGSMTFKLYEEQAPLSVMSFIGLVEGTLLANEDGSSYYSDLSFYRVIENYSLFSGDPENTGEGNTGISFPQETGDLLDLNEPGVLALQGFPGISQAGKFFITIMGDGFLNKVYTPFGKIVSGDEYLNKIDRNDAISQIEILRIGKDAEEYRADEEAFKAAMALSLDNQLTRLKESNPELAAVLESIPGYLQTETGIYYKLQYEGYGDKPRPGDRVSVHYTGKLLNGTIFDSSIQRGTPFELEIGKDPVISGWVESLMDMRPGENRIVVIPPELAYGERGAGSVILPGSWLVFEMQLMSVDSE